MSKKYLVPLDGSELAEHALPWAQILAKKFDTQIELLRCYEPLASIYMLPEFAAPSPVYYDQSAFYKQIDEYLDKTMESIPRGLAVKMRCEGDPGMAILDRAESGEIEAIIMASHGRGGLGRWLLGSIATKVVRGSKIPVLIVNATTDVPSRPQVNRILVPLDGSETSETALPTALKLADAFGADILLFQGVPHTPIGHPQLDAAVVLEVANAKEYLESVKSRYPESRIAVEARVAGPSLGIVKAAEKCDLVVMSSHGRSGVRRWLLGSIAENVLQSVHKPLMIVYQREEE
jgi:nucleotide-binding universal stress UspA family protein